MNQINRTKEDVRACLEEMEKLLAKGYGSTKFLQFLVENIYLVGDILQKIEIGNYEPHVILAYQNPSFFGILAKQYQDLIAIKPKRVESKQVNEIKENLFARKDFVLSTMINKLAEPLEDKALAILLEATLAASDYNTNTVGITVNKKYIGEWYNGDKIHLQLEGFRGAWLWFRQDHELSYLDAKDEQGNTINMSVTDRLICDIYAPSFKDSTSSRLESHLKYPCGYANVSQYLDNLENAVHNFAVQRRPEMANEEPLTFEQIQIAKTNVFRYLPASNLGLSEQEKSLVYKR